MTLPFMFFLRQKREGDSQGLKLGIIGGGHIGKQLARTMLHLGGMSGKSIQISTRRPETLGKTQVLDRHSAINLVITKFRCTPA